MSLAIFDLDNTLIAGDSDHLWGEFIIEQGLVDEAYYRSRNDQFYEDYKKGELDIMAYLKFALSPLTAFEPAALAALHKQFMEQKIQPIMLPKAQALVAEHRAQGHKLLIITATNRFITEPIAHALGIDEMLASEPEVIDGRYTGNAVGVPCFQAGKVTRFNAWRERNPFALADTYFYSDSANDIPLLQTVGKPVAVDPDERLAQFAREQQFPIISLR